MASRTVRARLDDASEDALAMLVREGGNESEAVRLALVELGGRNRRRTALADEVRRLADDPQDSAERRADMGHGVRRRRLARVNRGDVHRIRAASRAAPASSSWSRRTSCWRSRPFWWRRLSRG